MSKHELGADRVLHEGAGYRDKYKFKDQKPPVGSRENQGKSLQPEARGDRCGVHSRYRKMGEKVNHGLIDQNHKSGIM